MDCAFPPAPADHELLAYLDGEADAWVSDHLAQCVHCYDRMEQLAATQAEWQAHLYRATCPLPHALGEYHLGLLSGKEAGRIRRHLGNCPLCTQDLAQLQQYEKQLAPEIEWSPGERLKVLVARLVSGGLGNALAPPPALQGVGGLRGTKQGPAIYQVEDLQIVVESQEDSEHPGERMLLGLVTAASPATARQVYLYQQEQRVATTTIDELGNFSFSSLSPGRYELRLGGMEDEIHIEGLDV